VRRHVKQQRQTQQRVKHQNTTPPLEKKKTKQTKTARHPFPRDRGLPSTALLLATYVFTRQTAAPAAVTSHSNPQHKPKNNKTRLIYLLLLYQAGFFGFLCFGIARISHRVARQSAGEACQYEARAA
jgi:hypothetical protein